MNIWEKMEEKINEFSPKEKAVYELVKKEPYSFASSTSMEIAKKYNISQSSISRFCQRLGFDGYTDFRMSIMASDNRHIKEDIITTYPQTLSSYIDLLSQSLDYDQLIRIIQRISDSDNIYTSGYGISNIPASYLSFLLMTMNINAYHIEPSHEVEHLHIIKNSDIIFLFSASNPSHNDLFVMLNELPKKQWPYIILISSIKNHPFKKYVDETVVLPGQDLLNSPYFINTSIPQIDFVLLFTNFFKEIITK